MNFAREWKLAFRSLMRNPGLACAVVCTLALGIGANAAVFALLRGVLLRPLANRGEDRIVYIRQSDPSHGIDNTTFSMPEIRDLRERVKTVASFGDFSTVRFTMIGLGEPREVRAGVVSGSYFDVTGLRPALGRLLGPADDGPNAAGAAVLANRFWMSALRGDPSIVGRTVRLGTRSAVIVGVLEPATGYPVDTELMANVATSPHHLSALMVVGRVHRMTELFGRLAPGASLEAARAELRTVHASMMREHPEAYGDANGTRIDTVLLRDQVTAKARPVLELLMAASVLLFLVACANAVNLMLARAARRASELAVRRALGAGTSALRLTLLAESTLLCAMGGVAGIAIAHPMTTLLANFASRYTVRALNLTIDSGMTWAAAGLALAAAFALAFVPRLPSAQSAGARVTSRATRRLRVFAVAQIAAGFLLLSGTATFAKSLLALLQAQTGVDTRHVVVVNVPVVAYGRTPQQVLAFYQEAMRRVRQLPGVDHVAMGTQTPWREARGFGPGFTFTVDGQVRAAGEQEPRAQFRMVSPDYFAALGVPVVAGRDFRDLDRDGAEKVVIVSQTLAQRMFPNQDAVGRHLTWTDPIARFAAIGPEPRRIVGVAADIDDDRLTPGTVLTVYQPSTQEQFRATRLFVHTSSDPNALITPITATIRQLSTEQPVENAASLADIRAEMLTPDRLNTVVLGAFAAVALAIAMIGVAGVLAFSVRARLREFGIRLAVGSQRRHIVADVAGQGVWITLAGVAIGIPFAIAFGTPGVVPLVVSGLVLLAAAVAASLAPALRAARVDVLQVLRAE